MNGIADHRDRCAIANELHARPFPSVTPPARAAFLAIKPEKDAATRDREADRAHLVALLDRHGAPHPAPGAIHHAAEIGRYRLKWESHTEFVTYTIFDEGNAESAFAAEAFDVFPADWLAEAPGVRVTSALIRIEPMQPPAAISEAVEGWFERETLAVSNVLDGAAVIAGDFRIDPAGHMRFAVFAGPECSPRRVGRVVTRLCEIETYKAMALLGLLRVRRMLPEMGRLEDRLTELVAAMAREDQTPSDEEHLHELLGDSAALEALAATSSFRFGATAAYAAIVAQRIEVLRESRFEGKQTFREFMSRRFDPAMRTVEATERRLEQLTRRAERAANLLRTRVDVERSAQNKALLESMDRRAALQLRLQHTVEGLSVVAISYYAVSLAGYLLYPLTGPFGVSKGVIMAAVTVPVIGLVWWSVRRIRKALEQR